VSKIKCFRWPRSENVKDRIQIQAYKINKENATHFSQFISGKVEKILRKSQAQFQESSENRG